MHHLLIRSSKFPILDGEDAELTNPGTYGKTFAQFLQTSLKSIGYNVPFIVCEDWGWWVEIKLPNKIVGLCCYRHHDENTECHFVCSTSTESNRVWSWRRFRMIDIGDEINKLVRDLTIIFTDDSAIEFLSDTSDFPF